ncbi:MAG: deoxyribose-phosphate aldolase, partial [Polyangiaceae bacterium]
MAQFANGNGTAARTISAHPDFSAPTVDKVMVEERAAALGKRSIKKAAKVAGLKLAISMMDLTTLEGKDTPGKVRQMCQK